MEIIRARTPLSEGRRGSVAALGNFDGVHRGHACLIAEARKRAAARGAPLSAVVFDPHPREFFRPHDRPFLLTDLETRARLLGALGVEFVIALDFDADLAAMSADAFVEEILAQRLGLAGVVVGAEFRYGRGREGDADSLRAAGARLGIEAVVIAPAQAPGATEKFSSTDARAAIREGDPQRAARLLGRLWAVSGIVLRGEARGRELGFPTANLRLGRLVTPKPGVYAVIATLADGRRRRGVANYGRRPTLGDLDAPLLEVHLFDFDGDLYGQPLRVAFVEFIREERRFDGLSALRAQIAEDAAAARRLLARENHGAAAPEA